MTQRPQFPVRRNAWQRMLPIVLTCAATLISAPGHAITIPAVPLQSGSAYPPANIRFILDDSGSMTGDVMPDSSDISGTTPVDVKLIAYNLNTLSYNPNVTYKPWMTSTAGTRLTGGTSYSSAYDDDNLATTTVNLGSGTKTFYVLKDGASNKTITQSYWRYVIQSGGSDIIRSEYGAITNSDDHATGYPQTVAYTSGTGNYVNYSFTVPAGLESMTVSTAGGDHGNNSPNWNNGTGNGVDLYLDDDSNYTTSPVCYRNGGGNDESCVVNNPAAGTWYVGLYTASRYKNVTFDVVFTTSNRCPGTSGSTTWINCTSATPDVHAADGTISHRSVANELINYATWYSYHRTRIKVAKAGASEAFAGMGSSVRVGYDTIWNRSAFEIPVGTNNGVFSGTNRDTWYSRLQAAQGSSTTPLKGALQRAGKKFQDTTATGPWGPESGSNQLSCRQNFAILTTDGYWNDNTGYTTPVGDADATAGPTNTDPKGGTLGYTPANPYKDNYTTNPNTQPNTLADVAMYYWKTDLRPETAMVNNVPTSTADPAFWQHMVMFGVSIGQQGRLNPKTDLAALSNGTKHWGDPTDSEDADRIDDLWHASVNGHGSFVTAGSPSEFTQGLLDALKTVAARLGSASNVTSNSTSFSSDTRIYQASYVSGKWTGELSAYNATAAGVSTTAAWTAASQITATGRKVYTWDGSAGTTFPTTAQVTALDQSSRSLSPVSGANNAAYIKGDRTNEGSDFGDLRQRETLLGDIVDSSPMYVKDTDAMFVGANDGMLHAFNASSGAEYFAYVPGGVSMADLASLSDPQYTHKYFVDGPIVVSTQAQTPSHNYLVGALGRGGKGIFGLDVTTPASFNPVTNVLWEKTSGGDMGYVLGEPLIVTLNDGSNTKAVIVGNGINSTNAHAVLFVYNLATGALIQTLDTGVGGDNGMSAPRGWDDNGDGTVDYVYAGDMKGNLWKFNFTGATASIAQGGTPLFSAASGQPITAGLALASDPTTGKRWVFAGTGKFMENGDVNDKTVQSMYGIIDDAVTTTLHRSDLQARTIVMTDTVNGKSVRGFESNGPLNSGVKGWYIDLNKPTVAGERVISRPQVKGSVLVVASIIPPTNNSCEAGGSGYINALDAFTGSSTTAPYFDANGDGKVDASDTLTQSGTTVPVGSIDLGVGMPTLPTVIDKLLVVGGSTGGLGSIKVNPQGGAAQRVSWREILGD